jgi:hypothetical protein
LRPNRDLLAKAGALLPEVSIEHPVDCGFYFGYSSYFTLCSFRLSRPAAEVRK